LAGFEVTLIGRFWVTLEAPCPVCRLPQPVRPYGGRYKIVDHREPENANGAAPTRGS
jgi:hypothetical protein